MRKINKKIVSNVIVGLLVVCIVSVIGVGAATLFASSDVVYDNTNSGASATNVKDALDELYGISSKWIKPNEIITHEGVMYYNPISGEICDDYVSDNSLNNNKGATTDTECMKWYIIGSNTDTIDMILDHNTSENVLWDDSIDSSVGPTTALAQLKTDTDGWTGVPERTDTYTDPRRGYTINYSGYRARLIEANEIAELTGADKALSWDSATSTALYYLDGKYGTDSTWQTEVATSQGASKYAWLYDYTDVCTDYGCNIADTNGSLGYWTSSASANHKSWAVDFTGSVYSELVHGDFYGLRPVITISKS